MGLPAAVAGVLQGSILFFVLGANVFVNYRLRIIRPQSVLGIGGRGSGIRNREAIPDP
jgi:ABC-type uncharacterized transport system permease subunit